MVSTDLGHAASSPAYCKAVTSQSASQCVAGGCYVQDETNTANLKFNVVMLQTKMYGGA
jgi:hypothetical protein